MRHHLSEPQGMSLLELVVVTALVALLLTLAVPAWVDPARRAHRVDAVAGLYAIAACQERFLVAQGHYSDVSCQAKATTRYRFEVTTARDPHRFSARAIPLGNQSLDRCGALVLRHDGQRQVERSDDNASDCWQLK